MSVIETLITDRTAYDLFYLEDLQRKVETRTATTTELAEWIAGPRGAYNAADLNRVGEALLYLMRRLNGMGYTVTVSPRTNWTRADRPTPADMAAYLGYVETIRGILSLPAGAPQVPSNMEGMTLEEANDIERILVEVEKVIDSLNAVHLKTAQMLLYCGYAVYMPEQYFGVQTSEELWVYTSDGFKVVIRIKPTDISSGILTANNKYVYTADNKKVFAG